MPDALSRAERERATERDRARAARRASGGPGRLPYMAAALFIAVLLWAVVRGDQVIERTMTLPLSPTLDDGLRLDGAPPQVRVRVSGRARELVKLASGAPLRADASDATPGTLRLDLRATSVELPDGVDALVRDVRPRSVTLKVARVAGAATPPR